MKSILSIFALLCALTLSGCSVSQHVAQFANDHIGGFTGAVSVDPVTGAITVTGNVSFKEMEAATTESNRIIAANAARGVYFNPNGSFRSIPQTTCTNGQCTLQTREVVYERAEVVPITQRVLIARDAPKAPKIYTQRLREVTRTTRDVCGNKVVVRDVKPASIWYRFTHPCACYTAPVLDTVPDTSPPLADQIPSPSTYTPAAPVTTTTDTVTPASDGSFVIPPATKATTNLEDRVAKLEVTLAKILYRLDNPKK